MDGLVLIDKLPGWTSHDVVVKIRGILRQTASHKVKVGHTGTLDPFASGLLVLVVGDYCKRAQEFSKLDKVYEVTMRLGETSVTGDPEGEIRKLSHKRPKLSDIQLAFEKYTGSIEQTPPAYSAIKVGGKRAYELARQGHEVKLEPRLVTIYSYTDASYDYPDVRFTVTVSSGTYIRTLVEDIGQVLGAGAYTSGLRRLAVGGIRVEESQYIEVLGSASDVNIYKTNHLGVQSLLKPT